MKEFKGTQGKWKLSISKRGRKAHITGRAWQNHTKVYIQTQDIEGNYTDSLEGIANAHLIANAPELLESLQQRFGACSSRGFIALLFIEPLKLIRSTQLN